MRGITVTGIGELLISVIIVCVCWAVGYYVLTVRILGKEWNRRLCFFYCLAFCAIQLPMNFLLYVEAIPYSVLLWDIGLFTVQMVVFVIFVRRSYHENLAKILAAAALGHFVLYTGHSVFELAALALIQQWNDMSLFAINLLYSVLPHALMLLFGLLVAHVLGRVRFSHYFSYLFTTRGKSALTLAVCLLLMNSYSLYALFFPDFSYTIVYAASAFGAILLALFLLQFLATFALNKEKLRAQQETIRQQQAHLRLLEELQIELRSFRHDFQNLLAGAAIQAKEGDLEGIRAFLQNTAGYFDQKLGNEIRQMSVLDNIKLHSLRSLLAMKLAAMREQGITTELEAMRLVSRCAMREEDLLRCAGILLDNALEAAAGCEGGLVRILMLQEARELRIVVTNTCPQKPDLAAMLLPRHTTKGPGRGTGLSSYRRILAGYPRCVSRTLWEDGFLTVELRAGE